MPINVSSFVHETAEKRRTFCGKERKVKETQVGVNKDVTGLTARVFYRLERKPACCADSCVVGSADYSYTWQGHYAQFPSHFVLHISFHTFFY